MAGDIEKRNTTIPQVRLKLPAKAYARIAEKANEYVAHQPRLSSMFDAGLTRTCNRDEKEVFPNAPDQRLHDTSASQGERLVHTPPEIRTSREN